MESFRTLDQRFGLLKGTAFRAFKRLGPALREGEDFIRLEAGNCRDAIAELRASERIYRSSVNVVLFTASGVAHMEMALTSVSHSGDAS